MEVPAVAELTAPISSDESPSSFTKVSEIRSVVSIGFRLLVVVAAAQGRLWHVFCGS